MPFAMLGVVFGRVSFAVSLLILMGSELWRKLILWFIIITQFATSLVNIGVIMFGCDPVRKFWDRQIPGTCLSPKVGRYSSYTHAGKSTTIPNVRSTTSIDTNPSHQHLRGLGTGLDALSNYSYHPIKAKDQTWPYFPHGSRGFVSTSSCFLG